METMTQDPTKNTNAQYDFGPDADVVSPADAAFDAWVAKVAPALNAPADVPRAEMWQAIETARSTAREAQAGRIPGVTPLRRAPWRLMSMIAAALLLGVAIDRIVLRKGDRLPVTPPMAAAPARADSNDATRLYRMAAAQT